MLFPRISVGIFTLLVGTTAVAQDPAEAIRAQVRQVAREHLARQAASAGLSEPMFELTVVPGSRVLPLCKQAVKVEHIDAGNPARMRFAAICPGTDGWRQDMLVRASVSAVVVVTASEVAAGKALTADQLRLERRDITGTSDNVSDLAALIGMASNRALRAGTVVRKGQLAALPLVKRGEPVRISIEREQVEVSMAGEAMDAGALGALVRVRNTSGRIIRARVIGAGAVEPADLPAPIQPPD